MGQGRGKKRPVGKDMNKKCLFLGCKGELVFFFLKKVGGDFPDGLPSPRRRLSGPTRRENVGAGGEGGPKGEGDW